MKDNGQMCSLIVIPARLDSQRLPQKLLLSETGKPLIQHTYESASRARLSSGVLVAADCEKMAAAVRGFGGQVVLTDPEARSGTDRIAEAVAGMPEIDIVVNVQGDEPDICGAAIDQLISLLAEHKGASMATLATPLRSREKLDDPACVKVVFDEQGQALYFSRSAIPHVRDWEDEMLTSDPPNFYQHIGIYAYRRDFLLHLATMKRSRLERLENLEQLRALAAGETILVGVVTDAAHGIDTREDYEHFVQENKERR